MSTVNARSYNWCFTAFAPHTISDGWLSNCPGMQYWCYGVEICPETKKEHWQG